VFDFPSGSCLSAWASKLLTISPITLCLTFLVEVAWDAWASELSAIYPITLCLTFLVEVAWVLGQVNYK
jgi:hypothetical protein